MIFHPLQFEFRRKLCPRSPRAVRRALPLLLALAASTSWAVTKPAPAPRKPQAAQDELTARLGAAAAARQSGDPRAVVSANRLAIASALRESADLKTVEAQYTRAVELYRQSLQYEETPAADAALAFVEIQTGEVDKAIASARRALAADPVNLRANRVLASGLDQKGEYAEAVEPFSRVVDAEPEVDNLYPLAVCLLQTHKPEDRERAAGVFERMKKIAGDSGSLHVLIGRAYRDADDLHTAIAEFDRAIAIDPRTPHAHYFLGLANFALNDWKPNAAAEAGLRVEAEYYPNDYLANYMLGFLASGEHQYEESDKYLLAASKISPMEPEPFLYMGLNAFSQEKMDRAEEMLRKAVDRTGSDEERGNYQIRRAYVDLARILSMSGRADESRSFAARARALENKTMVETQQSVSAIFAAGGADPSRSAAVMPLMHKPGDVSGAEAGQPQAQSTLTPQQRAAAEAREKALGSVLALAFNDMATAEAMQGQFPAALESYRQAEQWDAALPGLEKNLGQCAFRAKDFAEAVHGLSKALAEKDSPALRAMLGLSYFASDQFAEAVKTFEPLGQRAMTDSQTGYAWAASLAHTGDLKKAAEVLTAFESGALPNETLLLAGQLWTEIGDYARATATLQRALQSDPYLLKAHFYIGLADIRWERWADAVQEFQTELHLAPYDAVAQYHLGFVYLQQSKIEEAKALFEQVVEAHPDYANAQYELGKILLDKGDLAGAVDHLEAAARLSPQIDYMHYQLQAAYRKLGRSAEADRELEIYKGLKAKTRERLADALKHNP
jgi:tetratricopeptide (TPR) repeat protein